jgi:hypothetical protein
MKALNENQKDILNVVLPFVAFWAVMTFFLSTTPNYIKENKIIEDLPTHVQSPVLEKYGELITKNK